MTKMRLVAAALALAVAFGGVVAAEKSVKSGPQVGEKVPGPFQPLNITGPAAGEKSCLYCRFGASPVAMIFAREATPEVKTLLKKIDSCCTKSDDMNSCVIFCSDESGMDKKLKSMAQDAGLKKLVVSLDTPTGPDGYNLTKDAAVTVLLYRNREVKANYAFKKGELNDKAVEQVAAETGKLAEAK